MRKKLLGFFVLLLFTVTLAACTDSTETSIDEIIVGNIATELTFENTTLEDDIDVPQMYSGYQLTWTTTNSDYLTTKGKVTRPTEEMGDQTVTLTVTITSKDASTTKDFVFTISALKQTVEVPDDSLVCQDRQHEENGVCVDDEPVTVTCPDGQHNENNSCVNDAVTNIDYTGYYEGADDLVGEELKAFLHELIDDHKVYSYGDLRDILQETDEDPDNPNNIILLYSGDSIRSTWDSAATWNREHVWPKSLGGFESDDAGSDMHHLRPTYTTVNSTRGNKFFDEGGSLVSKTDDCYSDGDSFEPRDEVKGDVARMMFYMAVRYEGNDGAAGSDLELVNAATSSNSGLLGNLELLIQWHLEDPVDEFEMNRNDVIYSYQENRNPFIDHPEFVELIWD